MPDPRPHLLVSPEWLAERLEDPSLRVFDCAVTRIPRPDGASIYRSEREAWAAKRIPGAGYLHMVEDLSDPEAEVPFTLAPPDRIAAVMAREGVGEDSTVVLYGRAGEWAVHRAWWVLTASGLRDVRVLDGGLAAWETAGLPLETAPPAPPEPAPPMTLTPRPEMRADKPRVARALSESRARLVNALGRELFEGRGDQVFGRPGRIPGSLSLPSASLQDETGRFLPLPELEARFRTLGVAEDTPVIPYCGGGIAASTLAFVLALLGHDEVALYDGSLLEWGADPDAPMETGPAA